MTIGQAGIMECDYHKDNGGALSYIRPTNKLRGNNLLVSEHT